MTSPIVITGTLVRDAQMRRTRAGASVLSFDIHPPTVATVRPAELWQKHGTLLAVLGGVVALMLEQHPSASGPEVLAMLRGTDRKSVV